MNREQLAADIAAMLTRCYKQDIRGDAREGLPKLAAELLGKVDEHVAACIAADAETRRGEHASPTPHGGTASPAKTPAPVVSASVPKAPPAAKPTTRRTPSRKRTT